MSQTGQNRLDYQLIEPTFHQDLYNEEGTDATCRIYGYKKSKLRTFSYHLFCILLIGLPYFLFKSKPRLRCKFKYKKCPISQADIFLVKDNHGKHTIAKLFLTKINYPNLDLVGDIKFFYHQHTKYVWVESRDAYGPLGSLIWRQQSCEDIAEHLQGLPESDYKELLNLYGPNKIAVEVKSYWTLFVEEIFNPFYLFQAFSVAIWCVDDYALYASCIVGLTLLSSITALIQTRKQSVKLRSTVESSIAHKVTVLRVVSESESCLNIDPTELVPGDLIVLPAANYIMPCDAVLLAGQSIVNESVLTGESVPITKTALVPSNEKFDINIHKRHVLFAGTDVIQTRYYGGEHVLARVLRTGFDTTKGYLVKSILFPSSINLQFYRDAFKVVGLLFLLAISGMVYCIYLYVLRHAKVEEIILRTLDIITIVVPPALPAAMMVGTVFSVNRLRKLKIHCISPKRINICGKIKLACFDKTGTLTDDGLSMQYVIPCEQAKFSTPINDISQLNSNSRLTHGMASCHSLKQIDGKLNGDPLDLSMFEFTHWLLEEPGTDENARYDMLGPSVVRPPKQQLRFKTTHDDTITDDDLYAEQQQIGLLREFPFSSHLRCMSMICKNLEHPNLIVFTKGAPEKLAELCVPHTVPRNFGSVLSYYSVRGYRVIALAYKELVKEFNWKEAQKVKRDLIECDLDFLGLLVLQNPLKPETSPVIQTLNQANIRTVMITGDNIMTAISVARDCGMVSPMSDIYILSVTENENVNDVPSIVVEKVGCGNVEHETVVDIYKTTSSYFAIDGKSWTKLRQYFEHLVPHLLVRCTIFARFQPDQKTQLVTAFQELDYLVSMVGDGANDCGALKAAHVGVSLSTAEASVAAPFTSAIPNISCLIWLILEGRCALVTSFAIFKYMALYSLIQFTSTLVLYWCHSMLGNYQFLYIDLIVTTTLALTMGYQRPTNDLVPKRPMSSLFSGKNLLPLMLHIIFCVFIQLTALYYLYQQKWFQPIPADVHGEVVVSWENTTIFTVSCFQYLILAWHFSKGQPYRQSVFTNYWFLLNILLLASFSLWIAVAPLETLADILELIYVNEQEHDEIQYRRYLLLLPLVHFILGALIEGLIADQTWVKRLFQFIRCKRHLNNRYKRLLQEQDFPQLLESLQPIEYTYITR